MDVNHLIEAFRRLRPEMTAEMLTPEGANGMCHYVSAAFADLALSEGMTNVDLVVVEGLREPMPNGSHPIETIWNEVWHVVARVGNTYVDWTARQFDRDANVPTMTSADEISSRWLLVQPYDDYIAEEDAMAAAYEQAA